MTGGHDVAGLMKVAPDGQTITTISPVVLGHAKVAPANSNAKASAIQPADAPYQTNDPGQQGYTACLAIGPQCQDGQPCFPLPRL